MKPTDTVIQISTCQCEDGRPVLTVLCKDGSIWERYLGKWECLLKSELGRFLDEVEDEE